MKFSIVSLTTVPDTDLGRRLHDLDNLDEKNVAKILFHIRKQETGNTEELRLIQQRITALSCLSYHNGVAVLRSYTVPECNERALLDDTFSTIKGNGPAVTWQGEDDVLRILRLRAMQHDLRAATFWRRQRKKIKHIDLAAVLQPPGRYSVSDLDEFAVSMSLPGLLGLDKLDAWQCHLAGDFESLRHRNELAVVNLYLLAVRFWHVSGTYSRTATGRAQKTLRHYLNTIESGHLRGFLDAWTR